MKYIIHRGYLFLRENSFMSIIYPFSRGLWVEFDIIYHNQKWRLCHDVHSLEPDSEHLDQFIEILERHRNMLCRGRLLVDVKWDILYNATDDVYKAMEKIKKAFMPFRDCVWIQVSFPQHLPFFYPQWTCGLLRSHFRDNEIPECDFLTVDITTSTMDDIIHLMKNKKYYIIGYTCRHESDIPFYTHHFPYIDALVYDTQLGPIANKLIL